MKKGLFTFLFSVLFAVSAWAGPFLVCAPQSNTTSYLLTLNGVEQEVGVQDMGESTSRLHFDLVDLEDGNYTGELKAKNIWKVSDPLPFEFNKAAPDCPSVIDISAQ
jgi:hypothetical protein